MSASAEAPPWESSTWKKAEASATVLGVKVARAPERWIRVRGSKVNRPAPSFCAITVVSRRRVTSASTTITSLARKYRIALRSAFPALETSYPPLPRTGACAQPA